MNCNFSIGITIRSCGVNGICSDNSTCVCKTGYSSVSDWITGPCIRDVDGLNISNIIIFSLSLLVTIAVFVKIVLLFNNNRIKTAIIAGSMLLPPLMIMGYSIMTVFTNEKVLQNSITLTVICILVNLFWQISAVMINKWLIISTASTRAFFKDKNDAKDTNMKAKLIVRILTGMSISTFLITTILHIILYVTKSNYVHIAYSTTMSIYVLSHVFPFYYSYQMEKYIAEHLKQSAELGDSRNYERKMDRLSQNMRSIRKGFAGTIIYLHNLIFILFTEFSPYYLQINFLLGLISSLGVYNLFSHTKEQNNSSSSGTNKVGRHSPTSAISDSMATHDGNSKSTSQV